MVPSLATRAAVLYGELCLLDATGAADFAGGELHDQRHGYGQCAGKRLSWQFTRFNSILIVRVIGCWLEHALTAKIVPLSDNSRADKHLRFGASDELVDIFAGNEVTVFGAFSSPVFAALLARDPAMNRKDAEISATGSA
jgi:hypothetical protein